MKKTKIKKISKRKQLQEIEKHLPVAYKPLTGWGYFLRAIFYSIPVIGWIVAWCKAARAKNRNVANYARMFGTFAVLTIIAIVAIVALHFAGVFTFDQLKEAIVDFGREIKNTLLA
ncbi:MAG: hypothetical protein E7584_06100 [Ruminococcaceae bacterium]|nr:hypothetical protein [Oscillospiraceae bacterium]